MIYLLGNVLLAKIYDAYKSMLKDDLAIFHEHQQVCIKKAFDKLASKDGSEHHISKETWHQFFIEYCDPAIGGVRVEDAKDTKYNSFRANTILGVFHGINIDEDKSISFEHFRTIMEVF